MQSQPGLAPGTPPQAQGTPSEPDRPFVQPPAQPGRENAPPAPQAQNQMPGPGQQAAFAPPDPIISAPVGEDDEASVAPPYTELGFQRPAAAPAPAPAQPAAMQSPAPPSPEPQLGGFSLPRRRGTRISYRPTRSWATSRQRRPAAAGRAAGARGSAEPAAAAPCRGEAMATAFDSGATRVEGGQASPTGPPPAQNGPPPPQNGPPGTRVLGPGDLEDDPAGPPPPPVPGGGPGTKVMSKTMVGDFDFLDDTPSPERPVDEIPPPSDRSTRRVLERFGFGFLYGEHDASVLLGDVRAQAEAWNAPTGDGIEATRVDGAPSAIKSGLPGVLLVGDPHSGPGCPG